MMHGKPHFRFIYCCFPGYSNAQSGMATNISEQAMSRAPRKHKLQICVT